MLPEDSETETELLPRRAGRRPIAISTPDTSESWAIAGKKENRVYPSASAAENNSSNQVVVCMYERDEEHLLNKCIIVLFYT